ncbi:Sec-independent protein translocase subunit TatA/TatB [Cerasicoccus frondis]|uniref:Sec-independent protein translocase subunit TatA/TatB n=1 Tax=Cerasicoccus frondis TaxID=490090 RepID=UPI0028529470|nr:twin-arginine translocase TatA/TatE family subunit [Cerasicoccus frondis]
MNMFLNSLPVAFLSNLQGWEIPLLVIFGLIIFGGKKLPEFARGAGQAIKEFKKASKSAEDTFKQAMNEEDEAEKPKQSAEPKREEAAKI